jgi:hypothetical protein
LVAAALDEHPTSVLGFALADRARHVSGQIDAPCPGAPARAQIALGTDVAPECSPDVSSGDGAGRERRRDGDQERPMDAERSKLTSAVLMDNESRPQFAYCVDYGDGPNGTFAA